MYRVGGGTGGVFFGMTNNCIQDSNQALYTAIKDLDTAFIKHPVVQEMLQRYLIERQRAINP